MTDEQKRLRRLYRWAVVKIWARRAAIAVYVAVASTYLGVLVADVYAAVPGGLLADVVPAVPNLDGMASITSLGFAVWYGWYITTKTIPRIIDKHDEQIRHLTEAFREECREMREKFLCKHGGQ